MKWIILSWTVDKDMKVNMTINYDHFIDKVNEQSIMSGHHKVLGSIPGQAWIFKISTT